MIPSSTENELRTPQPDPPQKKEKPKADEDSVNRACPDPTRYGDWEKGGRCIDF